MLRRIGRTEPLFKGRPRSTPWHHQRPQLGAGRENPVVPDKVDARRRGVPPGVFWSVINPAALSLPGRSP